MQRFKVLSILTIPVVAATLMLSAGAASATGSSSESPTIAGLTVGHGYVIVNPADSITKNGATFYPTGPISSTTLVVIPGPDGSLPDGLTTANIKSFVAQRANAQVASVTEYAYGATYGGFGPIYRGGGIIGTSASTKVLYGFEANAGTSQRNAGQGRGYYQGYNGSTFGTWSAFYSVGSATEDGGGGYVPWGNVASYAEFRAECATTAACGGYFWS